LRGSILIVFGVAASKNKNIYPATILISKMSRAEGIRIPRLLLMAVAFFAAMILFTSAFPSVFAHGGHQPPA
jgi:hypothetical protein